MKKTFGNKLIAVLCVVALLCGLLVGCGGKENQNQAGNDNTKEDNKNLHIMIYAKGYGSDWMFALEKAFEKKYEGVNVEITLCNTADVLHNDLKNGKNSKTDLYFDCQVGNGPHGMVEDNKAAYNNGQAMRDLTYLMNTKIPGEEKTLGEKMNVSLKNSFRIDGRDTADATDDTYYALPYLTDATGIYYNETVIDNALGKGKWEVPNTTDELIALCEKLKAKDCHMLLAGGLDTWAGSMFLEWWAQYEGLENYYKFFDGVGYDATRGREAANSRLIFEQPGRLASYETSYDVLSYESGYTLRNSAEIGVNSLNEYQTRFTLSKNKYALYPCGGWLSQEVKNNTTIESDSVIKMMKTPVISSIIESTNSYSNDKTKRLPNITSDAVLSQVIDYVDGKGTLPAGVTEAEVAVVKEARSLYSSYAIEHIVYAPEFSNAKKLADEFLLFMASDEGIQIFKDNCIGGFSAYELSTDYNTEGWNATELSLYEISKEAIYIDDFKYHPIFRSAGVSAVTDGGADTLDGLLCRPKGKTGKEIYQGIIDTYSNAVWKNIISQISTK